MSSDNAIYILITKSEEGKEEYRVRSITSEPSLRMFAECKVYSDFARASRKAGKLLRKAERWWPVEYGVQLIEFSDITYSEATARQVSLG